MSNTHITINTLLSYLYSKAWFIDHMQEAVQVLKKKVTQMTEKMESLEEKIPALERSHKQLLQDTLKSSMEENKVYSETSISMQTPL